MSAVGAAAAWLLAGVFAAAAIAKWRSPGPTAATLRRLGIPGAEAAARLLPGVEAAVAVGLVVAPRAAAPVAVVLLAAFTAVLGRALARGLDVTCGCFGAASRAPVSSRTLVRNGLLVLAALAAAAGEGAPTLAATLAVGGAALVGTVALSLAGLRQQAGTLWRVDPAPARPARHRQLAPDEVGR